MSGLKPISEIQKLAGDKPVALVEDGPINYVVLNRPPYNMINIDVLDGFHAILDKIEAKLKTDDCDGEEQVLVTVGQGEKCFSSGFDLKWWRERETNTSLGVIKLDLLLGRLLQFRLPTLAILNGHCVAGGLFLSMAHDNRIMKDGEKWIMQANEIPMGITVPSGFQAVVKASLPHPIANQLCLAKKIGVKEALKKEVVDSLYTSEDDLMKQVEQWLERVGPMSCTERQREATYRTKRLIHKDALDILLSEGRYEMQSAILMSRMMQDSKM